MSYVRNAWYVAAWSSELATEKPVGMHILEEPIVLWRNADGALTALENRCVHRLAPLSLGRCEGGLIDFRKRADGRQRPLQPP